MLEGPPTSAGKVEFIGGTGGDTHLQLVSQSSIKSSMEQGEQEIENTSQENERDRPWRTRSNALDVATLSPQRAKRILANREAAHRSRVKKLKYTKELETEVARLERDNETVLQTLSGAQDHYRVLQNEHNNLIANLDYLQQEEYRLSSYNAALIHELDTVLAPQSNQHF